MLAEARKEREQTAEADRHYENMLKVKEKILKKVEYNDVSANF